MIVVTNTEVWADTVGVQAAVTMFHGVHAGFGHFVLFQGKVGPSGVAFARRDGWGEGEAIKERYGFSGRPHSLEGLPEAISIVVTALEEAGHTVIYEEE